MNLVEAHNVLRTSMEQALKSGLFQNFETVNTVQLALTIVDNAAKQERQAKNPVIGELQKAIPKND